MKELNLSNAPLAQICDADFTTKQSLNMHVSSFHKKIKLFKCIYCGISFEFKKELHTHISLEHVKPFNCQTCDPKFRSKQCLKTHILSHKGIKPFKCTT